MNDVRRLFYTVFIPDDVAAVPLHGEPCTCQSLKAGRDEVWRRVLELEHRCNFVTDVSAVRCASRGEEQCDEFW